MTRFEYERKQIYNGLEALRLVQTVVSGKAGAVPDYDGGPTQDNIRTVILATIVELTELLQELNWKPWKRGQKAVNSKMVAGEFADVLAFIGLLIVYLDLLGVSTEELANAYEEKSGVNLSRFENGY